MVETSTTAVSAPVTAKQLPAWESAVFTVLNGVLGALSLDPATKSSLTATLQSGASTIATLAEDAPELAGEGAEAGIAAAGTALTTAAPVAAIPVALAEDVVEPVAGDLVDALVSKFETTLIAHNQNTIKAIGSLLGSPPEAVSSAQAMVSQPVT